MSLPATTAIEPAPAADRAALTRAQKAAILVHLLLREGADPGVARLPSAVQRRLARTLATVGDVDRHTIASIAMEFASQLDGDALRMPKTLRGAIRALDRSLSPNVVSDLASELRGVPTDDMASSAWDALGGIEIDVLHKMLEADAPEVIAVILSKLKPIRAAALMARFDDDAATRVAIAFSATQEVSAETVARIGLSLGSAMQSDAPRGLFGDPAERVGAILNAAKSGDRARVLGGLDDHSPDFAAQVRRSVFSWEVVPERLEPRDVPNVLRKIGVAKVVAAIGGDPEERVAAFLLGSISQRNADQMREEIQDAEAPKRDAIEEARQAFAAEVREMEEAGELVLLSPDEGEDGDDG